MGPSFYDSQVVTWTHKNKQIGRYGKANKRIFASFNYERAKILWTY
jgi:hypothetical protein